MNAGKNYSAKEFIHWTKRDIIKIVIVATIPSVLYLVGIKWVSLPLALVSIIGIATSFILGFRNSATYDRLWEARKIWGGIVNTSRTFTMLVHDNLQANDQLSQQEIEAEKKKLAYGHFAWLTALRHQLRAPKVWEITQNMNTVQLENLKYKVTEWNVSVEEELKRYVSDEDLSEILSKKNRASYILSKQGSHITQLYKSANLDLFHQIELQGKLSELYDHQGKSERIKNFPYPRQYTSISKFFVVLFAIMVPFGLIGEFHKIAQLVDPSYYILFVLFNIPASALVMWIFWVLEKVGEATENPFEGGPGDIPITSMSLNIENDCRDILGIERIDIPASDSKIIM